MTSVIMRKTIPRLSEVIKTFQTFFVTGLGVPPTPAAQAGSRCGPIPCLWGRHCGGERSDERPHSTRVARQKNWRRRRPAERA